MKPQDALEGNEGVEHGTPLKCPLCGWATRSKNVMNVHIKVGHTEEEVNGAVDDGRIIENPTWFFTPAP